MFRVAICDDEPVFLDILEDTLQSFCLEYSLDCEIVRFPNAKRLMEAEMDYSILLLDIQLDHGADGLQIGQELRRKGLKAQIIIVTSRDDLYKEGYKVSAHRYIEKPIKQSEFNEAMHTAIRLLENTNRMVTIRFGTEERLINVSSIIMIETHFRNRRIHVWNKGKIEYWNTTLTWNQILPQLPTSQFAFVQKSFLINFQYLLSRTTNTVTLEHSGILNISKRFMDEFNCAYVRFLRQEDENYVATIV